MKDRAAVLIVKDGRILLMRRRKPGGGIEPSETLEEAAVRERQTTDNVYELEWMDAGSLEGTSLRPSHAREVCEKALTKYRGE
ncbi:MAG: NUDIX domain-containing protein [Rubrobacteraceae bacterium]